MTTKSYNGWTNYETWAVNLWLDNDEGSQSYWAEQATEALEHADNDVDDAVTALAESIQEQHEESLPELHGFASDLLNAAMSEVNWREIARALVEPKRKTTTMTTTTTASNVQLIGMDEVERIYSPGIGRHWFDANSMRFFRTRLPQAAYKGDGGIYFVTSERFTSSRGSLPRAYSVRKLVGEGRIETVGDFNSMTKAQANGMAKRLAAAAKEEATT